MKFFLDTANVEEIREAAAMRIISGVTTNPALVSKEGRNFHEAIMEILSIVDGVVFAEVTGETAEEMIREARQIARWSPRMVIKLPAVWEAFKAAGPLHEEGIRTAVTLVYSPAQALLAAASGADYVAPFLARAYEVGIDGLDTVAQISRIFRAQNIETKILVASVRSAADAVKAAAAGADILTLPFGIIKQLATHPQTAVTLGQFLDEWKKVANL